MRRRRTWLLAFAATALAGLAARQLIESRALIEALAGPENYFLISSVLRYLSLPTIAVAAAAGFLVPRRFWLWALAAPCLMPLELVLQRYYSAARAGVIGPSDYFGLAVLDATILLVLVVLCAASSGLGAGLRLLVGRFAGRSSRPAAGSNSAGYERRS